MRRTREQAKEIATNVQETAEAIKGQGEQEELGEPTTEAVPAGSTPTISVTAGIDPTSVPKENVKRTRGMALSESPLELHRRAAQLIEDMRHGPMAPDWEFAQIGRRVHAYYRPDILEVAYYGFEVEPQGFIILSDGEHDFPVAHWSSTGVSPGRQNVGNNLTEWNWVEALSAIYDRCT